MLHTTRIGGYTKDLKRDMDMINEVRRMSLNGRTQMEPFGSFDARAKERGESSQYLVSYLTPRDLAGQLVYQILYLDPDKADNLMVYVPVLRRVRKLSATDTQDPANGQDLIYDDMDGFTQKISATRWPYKYEIIGEREYLVPAATTDGAEYVASKGLELKNVRFERRPCYVMKLTQLDPAYVYSYRILLIDKETFLFHYSSNYDRKGRLYRTLNLQMAWWPEMGALSAGGIAFAADHVDAHSTILYEYELPARWARKDVIVDSYLKEK